jgi:hypothetical protein
MKLKRPIFPLGTSNFKEIRAKGKKYVDKTMYIPLLRRFGKILFLARPKRFGKSLAISTMDSFFSGDKDLFKGLAVEEIMNSPDFVPRPVINLLMSRPSGAGCKDNLENGIISELTENAKRHGVVPHGADAADTFIRLIMDVNEAYNNNGVVLLIDEYDAPVTKVIQSPALSEIGGLLEDTSSVMSDFYSKIQDLDTELNFVFITGVTKFSQMGLFSGLINLKDISVLPEFAPFVGFTQEELENNFGPFIKQAADELRLSETELLAKIKDYYSGFSFDGETRLYNPQSALLFLQDKTFYHYWMKSGSNTLIRELLKDKYLTVDQFSGLEVSSDFIDDPGEIYSTPPEGFLYQAGYLTLRKSPDSESSYTLDYPNIEVRSSLAKLFKDMAFLSGPQVGDSSIKLKNHFDVGDIAGFVGDFCRLFNSISYDDHTETCLDLFLAIIGDNQYASNRLIDHSIWPTTATLSKKVSEYITKHNYKNANGALEELQKESPGYKGIGFRFGENYYLSNLLAFLLGTGCRAFTQVPNSLGRADLVVESRDKQYVIEIKVVPKSSQANAASIKAIKWIIDKDYGLPFSNPVLVGLAISEENRNIDACVYVENNQAKRLDMTPFHAEVL